MAPTEDPFCSEIWLLKYGGLCIACCLLLCRTPLGTCRFTVLIFACWHEGMGAVNEMLGERLDKQDIYFSLCCASEYISNMVVTIGILCWYRNLFMIWSGHVTSRWLMIVLAGLLSIWTCAFVAAGPLSVQLRGQHYFSNHGLDKMLGWFHPVSWTLPIYYAGHFLLELWCFCLVFCFFQDGRQPSGHPSFKKALRNVVIYNGIVLLSSIFMFIIEISKVQNRLSEHWSKWHGWMLLVLFSTKYVFVLLLIWPAENENAVMIEENLLSDGNQFLARDALHCGRTWVPPYDFAHGVALIICNSAYDEASNLPQLRGISQDARSWEETWKHLNFHIIVKADLNLTAIHEAISCLIRFASERKSDAVVFVFCGHGTSKRMKCIDGTDLAIEDVLNQFKLVQCLSEKPKLMFFDMCRGDGVELLRQSSQCLRFNCGGLSSPSLHQDFLICHSTIDGFTSLSHRQGHGVFSSEFSRQVHRLIEERASRSAFESPPTIIDAMTCATKAVSKIRFGRIGHKQCPIYDSTLTGSFILQAAG